MCDSEADLMEARQELADAQAKVAGLERVLAAALDVITPAQFGEMRARLDAEDQQGPPR